MEKENFRLRNGQFGHLFPSWRNQGADRQVFTHPRADGLEKDVHDRFLWRLVAAGAPDVYWIVNAEHGHLFGSPDKMNGSKTVWCRTDAPARDRDSQRFKWHITRHTVPDGDDTRTFLRVRNCEYGYLFAAFSDVDREGDHYAELDPEPEDHSKFEWTEEDWDFGDRPLSGFKYFQVEFEESGAWYSHRKQTGLAALLTTPGFAPLTDLFVMVHGMGNSRDGARDIYRSYFDTMRAACPADVDLKKVGVCGVMWPSGGGNLDYLLEGLVAAQSTQFKRLFGDGTDSGGRSFRVARTVAAHGLQPMLGAIAQLRPDLRVHLVAHSMGTVVAAWSLAGLQGSVESVFLIQGALHSHVFIDGGLQGAQRQVRRQLAATCSRNDGTIQLINTLGASRIGRDGFSDLSGEGRKAPIFDSMTAAARSIDAHKFINFELSDVILDHDGYKKPEVAAAHWLVAGFNRR